MAVYSGGSLLGGLSSGKLGTVPEQNLFEKNWQYVFDPTNMKTNFEAHYLTQILGNVFK